MTSWGSYGDVFPYLALARGLALRGHQPMLAAPAWYRDIVGAEGIAFHAMRPDVDPTDSALIARIMHSMRGPEVIIRELIAPRVRETYEDVLAAAEHADLIMTHPLTMAARLVAEVRGLPWVSTILAPLSLFSAHDPPVFPPAPWMRDLARLGPWAGRLLVGIARVAAHRWTRPVHRFRAELGLPPGDDPLFEGQFSPRLTLALFSPLIAEPQPDWPAGVRVTGFPFHHQTQAMPPELDEFLDAGSPPVVFTLGSSAVGAAGTFYEESIAASTRLGVRAVLLVGTDPSNRSPRPLPPGMIEIDYAPHAQLFPRALATVHQGGIGTTAEALRAGRPMLIVPFAHDQPDNAYRVARLGVSHTLPAKRYSAARAAAALGQIVGDPAYASRAAEIGAAIGAENGVESACDALEALMAVAA